MGSSSRHPGPSDYTENEKHRMMSISGRLYRFDQIPSDFYELGIIHGYRNPSSTFIECVKSLFLANNETLNFWTHFLPVFYFIWRLAQINDDVHFYDSYTWPLLAYAVVCSVFPLTSALAHAFNTMSVRARHICFFFDYAALSCFSFGSALVYRAYVWPESLMDTAFSRWYVHTAFVNAVACTFVSGRTRFGKFEATNKIFRLGAFAIPYLFVNIPFFYRIVFEDYGGEALMLHKRQFLFCILSVFFYASHLPERLFPGRFDIIGHSHQLFHIAGMLATRDILSAVDLDMKNRKDSLLSQQDTSVYGWSLSLASGLLVINLVTVFIHSRHLYRNKPQSNNNEEKCHCH